MASYRNQHGHMTHQPGHNPYQHDHNPHQHGHNSHQHGHNPHQHGHMRNQPNIGDPFHNYNDTWQVGLCNCCNNVKQCKIMRVLTDRFTIFFVISILVRLLCILVLALLCLFISKQNRRVLLFVLLCSWRLDDVSNESSKCFSHQSELLKSRLINADLLFIY